MTPVKPHNEEDAQVLLEFIPVGQSVKVVAIHAATGVEVSIVGSRSASQLELEKIVVRKLEKRLLDLAKQASK